RDSPRFDPLSSSAISCLLLCPPPPSTLFPCPPLFRSESRRLHRLGPVPCGGRLRSGDRHVLEPGSDRRHHLQRRQRLHPDRHLPAPQLPPHQTPPPHPPRPPPPYTDNPPPARRPPPPA